MSVVVLVSSEASQKSDLYLAFTLTRLLTATRKVRPRQATLATSFQSPYTAPCQENSSVARLSALTTYTLPNNRIDKQNHCELKLTGHSKS